jgi:hypothetical protein
MARSRRTWSQSSAEGNPLACDECRDLNTHVFRSQDDLIHALQVAAAEMDRGVLEQARAMDRAIPEDEALRSAMFAGAVPDSVVYRFKCALCGDAFELNADTSRGAGGWTRIEAHG